MHEFGFSWAMDSLFEAQFWILGRQTLEGTLGFEEEELNYSISSVSSAYVQNSNDSKTTKRK